MNNIHVCRPDVEKTCCLLVVKRHMRLARKDRHWDAQMQGPDVQSSFSKQYVVGQPEAERNF